MKVPKIIVDFWNLAVKLASGVKFVVERVEILKSIFMPINSYNTTNNVTNIDNSVHYNVSVKYDNWEPYPDKCMHGKTVDDPKTMQEGYYYDLLPTQSAPNFKDN